MFSRILCFIIAVVLAGCSASPKKQPAQMRSVTAAGKAPEREISYATYEIEGARQIPAGKSAEQAQAPETPVKLSATQAQRALKSAGFYKGAIDGKIGPKTKEAIRQFQKANGLKVDGIVGKRTAAILNKYLSQ